MNGATRPLILAIIELDPTAMLRTGVGNSSDVYRYPRMKVAEIAIFPTIVRDATTVTSSAKLTCS